MSISFDTFKNVALRDSDKGYVKASQSQQNQNPTLNVYGNSKHFGGLASSLCAPKDSANRQLRNQFVMALQDKYGDECVNYLKETLNLSGKSKLSVATVKSAISAGEEFIKLRKESIDIRASQDVEMLGFMAAKKLGPNPQLPQGHPIPEMLTPDIEAQMEDIMGELVNDVYALNSRADELDTKLNLSYLDLIPKDMAAKLDKEVHELIVVAIGDPKDPNPVSTKDVQSMVSFVFSEHKAELKEMMQKKENLLNDLWEKEHDTTKRHYAAADILRSDGNFSSIDDFFARSGRSEPGLSGLSSVYDSGKTKSLKNNTLDTALATKSNIDEVSEPAKDFFNSLTVTNKQNDPDREFHLNRQVLAHFAEKVKITNPEAAMSLCQRSLGHMMRFASSERGGNTGRHENPLIYPKGAIYSRGGTAEMTKMLTAQLAKSLGVDSDKVIPVTDGRVLDVIKRDFANKDIGSVFDLSGAKTPKQQGEALYDIIKGTLSKDQPVFLDTTEFMAGTLRGHGHDLEELQLAMKVGTEYLTGMIDDTIEAYVEDYNKHNPNNRLDSAKVKETVHARLTLGSIIQVGDQEVLYTHMAAGGSTRVPGNPDQMMDSLYRNLIGHNGFTVGPNQLLENWTAGLSTNKDPTRILQHFNAIRPFPGPDIDFSKANGSLKNLKTVKDLADTDTFKEFADLQNSQTSAMEKTLPAIAISMLEILEIRGMHNAFEEAGLEDLQCYLLNHIETQMAVAVQASKDGNQSTFINTMELIQADIATMTEIAKPYTESDFHDEMLAQWKSANMGAPQGVDPKFSLTNSGMRSLSSVLSGMEAMLGPGKPLNVAVAKNSYYESAINLSSGRRHRTFEMSDTNPKSSIAGLSKVSENDPDEKVNLLVTEFHHNINMGVYQYQPVPVTQQIKEMLASDHVAEKLTVAIDNTISVPNENDMKTLLADPVIAKALQDGKLNIVTYRSAQKFDMAGYDNYNGGIVNVLNNGSFNNFENGMKQSQQRESNISDVNYQGMTLFQHAAGKHLQDYRRGIIGNTNAFTQLLQTEDKLTEDNRGAKFLQFTPNLDPSAVFLDIRSAMLNPDDKGSEMFYGSLQVLYRSLGWDSDNNLCVGTRPSFGFAHSNVSVIGGDRFRFNPGLEKTLDMVAYKKVIDNINTVYNAIEHSLPESGQSGRNSAKQITDLVNGLASAAYTASLSGGEEKVHVHLETIVKGLADDAGLDEMLAAATLLKKFGINNLAQELVQRAPGIGGVLTLQQTEALNKADKEIGIPPDITQTDLTTATTKLTTEMHNAPDQVLLKELISQANSTRKGFVNSGGEDAGIQDVVANITSKLNNLDSNALAALATALETTAGLYAQNDSNRAFATALAQAVRALADV